MPPTHTPQHMAETPGDEIPGVLNQFVEANGTTLVELIAMFLTPVLVVVVIGLSFLLGRVTVDTPDPTVLVPADWVTTTTAP
jgi:hypothetical protein